MKKDIAEAVDETNEPGSRLRSELGTVELTAIGLAVMVGAGIFTTAPTIYRDEGGVGLFVSLGIAAAICIPVALCFAECTTRIPVAGSAYTFAYVTFGRPWAWLVSCLLFLEYTIGSAVVAKSWSNYLNDLFRLLGLGVNLPRSPVDWGAVIIVGLLIAVLSAGLKVTSRFTVVATSAKLLALVFVIIIGALAALAPRDLPPSSPSTAAMASYDDILWGAVSGAALLFYAFIGFDTVSTMAEEARFPRRDLSRGILWSLFIASVLYVGLAWVMVGLVPAEALGAGAPGLPPTLGAIFEARGLGHVSPVITVGALVGLTTGILVLILGQSRIALAMSRDGLFFAAWATLGWRRTPTRIVFATGIICAVAAGIGSTEVLQPIVNIGTLAVFAAVCLSASALRSDTYPRAANSFKVPGGRLVAIAGFLLCVALLIFAVIFSPLTSTILFGVYALLSFAASYPVRRNPHQRNNPRGRLRGPLKRWWRWQGDDFIPTRELLRQHNIRPIKAASELFAEPDKQPAGSRALPRIGEPGVVVLHTDIALEVLKSEKDPLEVIKGPVYGYLAITRETEEKMKDWAAESDDSRKQHLNRALSRILVLPRDERVKSRLQHVPRHSKHRQGDTDPDEIPEDVLWAVACCTVRKLPLVTGRRQDFDRWTSQRLLDRWTARKLVIIAVEESQETGQSQE